MSEERNIMIKGINVCNPIAVEKEYLLYTVDYAAKYGFNHIQINGPIHHAVIGNIDGMTPYRKYHMFDSDKDDSYIQRTMEAVNGACQKAAESGINIYVWHHELELPLTFSSVHPEVCNCDGDIEVSHPLVRDFLENKIIDFFYYYPNVRGIILTLHETKVPLLKLKNQRLGKIERVKYVTKVLFDICESLGKELIVRPFASIEEDYKMMATAYEEISSELLIMDKWTQFDWSLTLPSNKFYHKIRKNPLLVEADIFGEYFGKGRLPLMLKKHIAEKVAYCDSFSPRGYVARIDRNGEHPFGDINEVNIRIFHAQLNHHNVESVVREFFDERYPNAANEVRQLMEQTEEILTKTIYAKGYYFSELSYFPRLNHCKNHYYFEMMRENGCIDSNEWYIPKDWKRGTLEGLLEEKRNALDKATELLEQVVCLKNRISPNEYDKLWIKFCNLKLVTEIWIILTMIFIDYVGYFEHSKDCSAFEADVNRLLELNRKGLDLLGEHFYGRNVKDISASETDIECFAREIRESFQLEKETVEQLGRENNLLDYIVCGGGMEGHRLQKEVNFSDTLIRDGALCRIPGSLRGMGWCSVNAHGWFSYLIRVTPYANNEIRVLMEGFGTGLDVGINIGESEYLIHETTAERKEISLIYTENVGNDAVRICFNKISGCTPCIFTVKVMLQEPSENG